MIHKVRALLLGANLASAQLASESDFRCYDPDGEGVIKSENWSFLKGIVSDYNFDEYVSPFTISPGGWGTARITAYIMSIISGERLGWTNYFFLP